MAKYRRENNMMFEHNPERAYFTDDEWLRIPYVMRRRIWKSSGKYRREVVSLCRRSLDAGDWKNGDMDGNGDDWGY